MVQEKTLWSVPILTYHLIPFADNRIGSVLTGKGGEVIMKEYIMEVADSGMVTKVKQEIVRCKDCEYYRKPSFGFTFGECTYGSTWYPTNEDDYCSKGKRKET